MSEAPRLAAPGEAPALSAIARGAYAPYVPLIGAEPPPMQQDFPGDIAAGKVWVLGAPDAYLVTYPKDDAWFIENVAVAPAAQGRGHGGALMRFAETLARRAGLTRMALYTNGAMAANLKIYAHLGYREVDRRTEHGMARVFFVKAL